jgi:copper chaperone CopZ
MYKTLIIDGMHCGHCAGIVQVELYRIPEVQDVSVNVMKRNAIVRLSKAVDVEVFAQHIESVGYSLERLI